MKLTDGQAVTLQARVTGSSPVDSAPSYQSGLPQFDWGGFGRGRPSSVWVVCWVTSAGVVFDPVSA
jgi:hypothetical protein